MSIPIKTMDRIDFCDRLSDLINDQSEWSQANFGSDQERGPIGTLKHLEKEAREAYESYSENEDNYQKELADCLLLLLDATRRSCLSFVQLVDLASNKMKTNKAREWPKNTKLDEPVEHIKNEVTK